MTTAVFLKSAASPADFPADAGREVAFVGRSNSGKSTAVNVVTGARKLARVSKTPGRTQLLNFFTFGEGRRLVDLPGYGFARVAPEVQARWGKSLEADSVITGLRWLSENSKFYGNPQVDEAINKARSTFGVPERTRVYQDADRLLREDAVGLFTHAQSELYGTNRRYPWQPWAYAGNAGLLTYYVPKG